MNRNDKLITRLSIVYMVMVCGYMIIHRIWFSPDQFFTFALFASLLLKRTQLFILDWGPFLSMLLGYEYLRGLVPFISKNVHIVPMIQVDQFIFGFIPTIKFQSWLYNPSRLQWYDYAAVTLYICHFVTPMLVGFYLWIRDRNLFKEYALGVLLLSYAAFITYILYPAMPPWMASSKGYLPKVQEVTGVVMAHFMPSFDMPTFYSKVGGNPVAAMPSLHAALPTLIFLFLFYKSKKIGLAFFPYVLGVWFAVIYLGEHYFIDVLAGAIYALVAFGIVIKKDALLAKLQQGKFKGNEKESYQDKFAKLFLGNVEN